MLECAVVIRGSGFPNRGTCSRPGARKQHIWDGCAALLSAAAIAAASFHLHPNHRRLTAAHPLCLLCTAGIFGRPIRQGRWCSHRLVSSTGGDEHWAQAANMAGPPAGARDIAACKTQPPIPGACAVRPASAGGQYRWAAGSCQRHSVAACSTRPPYLVHALPGQPVQAARRMASRSCPPT